MLLKTSDINSIKPYFKKLNLPKRDSHKGQNGRLLIIGGSRLFHSASLWSAEVASHFVDLVHYCSTHENNQIFVNLKSRFTNGIIIEKKDLLDYVEEDDCILLGPGMVRGDIPEDKDLTFASLLKLTSEADYGFYLTKFLLKNYPNKKFVIDGGALQMVDAKWLKNLNTKSIITPHQGEFKRVFKLSVDNLSIDEKKELVLKTAAESNSIILLKAVDIILSDGEVVIRISGGNQGLTKGGTGDVLAGLVASLNTKNNQLLAAIVASFLLKKSADILYKESGLWFNTTDLITQIPKTLKTIY